MLPIFVTTWMQIRNVDISTFLVSLAVMTRVVVAMNAGLIDDVREKTCVTSSTATVTLEFRPGDGVDRTPIAYSDQWVDGVEVAVQENNSLFLVLVPKPLPEIRKAPERRLVLYRSTIATTMRLHLKLDCSLHYSFPKFTSLTAALPKRSNIDVIGHCNVLPQECDYVSVSKSRRLRL